MAAHSKLSPSKAAMWMRCPKSANVDDNKVDLSDPTHRRLGTAMHHFRERALIEGLDAFDLVGESVLVEGVTFTLEYEQALLMQPGIDRVRSFGGEIFTEMKVDLSFWLGEGEFGTLDTGVVTDDLIVISDYKNGFLEVEAEGNEQLQLYALGFWMNIAKNLTNAKKFLLIIDQPNKLSNHQKDWLISLEDLLKFGEKVRESSRLVKLHPDKRVPSEKACRWCKAKDSCIGLSKLIFSYFGEGNVIKINSEGDLTNEQRIEIYDNISLIKGWLNSVEQRVLDDAKNGVHMPGKKLVYGYGGFRKWIDEGKVKELMLEVFKPNEVLNERLKTPTQIEKILGKEVTELLSNNIVKTERKLTLVDESDSRDVVKPEDFSSQFDDI